ncbi:hypothetical protein ACKI2C_47470, partial [Streptomyces brasiliscabiei]|uniref:hypothetical protein n=1 Tax=Streptomyces brasiliscabiei TaxID=2736302 RepID=UPI0038F795C0
DTSLWGLAATIAKLAGSQVVFELPDQEESAGYSTATKALLDTEKFQQLGFKADTDLEQALAATMRILAARS